MGYCIAYDCSNKDAAKKGFSFFRLPRDHKLRLTWFKKLQLVDPPKLTMSVCVVNTSLRSVSLLIMQAAMGVQEDKNNIAKIKHCSYVQGYRQQLLWIVTL